jgi:hypothetical protein
MKSYSQLERQIARPPSRRPVAVAFRHAPPAAMEKFAGSVSAQSSFRRLAAQGRVFYTVPTDHYHCPVGSYTHHIARPEERAKELPPNPELMAGVG